MIPKIIHYCRFGGSPLEKKDIDCINTWKKFHPDYEFMLWDERIFDLESDFLTFTSSNNNWACFTEHVRYFALKKYGGIYFDTDIILLKNLTELLNKDFFIGCENHQSLIGVSAIGSIPNHPILDEFLEYYKNYKAGDKLLWSSAIVKPVIGKYLTNFNSNEVLEFMKNSWLYPPEYFYPLPYEKADRDDKFEFNTKNSFTLHLWNASWVDEWTLFWAGRYKTAWRRVLQTLKSKPKQPKQYYKDLFYHLKRQIKGKKNQEI